MRRLIAVFVSSPLAALVLGACGSSSGPTGPSGPPVVTTVNGATAPSAPLGATVVIQGSNFGTSQAAAAGQVLFGTVPATIASAGDWSNTAVLPAAVAFAAAVVVSPANAPVTSAYLLVLGGDSTASGKPVATVYLGILGASGAVTGWSTTSALPAPVHSLGAVVFNGSVYIARGSAAGNTPTATLHRTPINSDGTLGAWAPLTSLPFARSYLGFGVNGTFLYAFGGDSSALTPNDSSSLKTSSLGDVVYGQIDVHTGNLTGVGWTLSTNKLKKPVAKHTVVVADGDVVLTPWRFNSD